MLQTQRSGIRAVNSHAPTAQLILVVESYHRTIERAHREKRGLVVRQLHCVGTVRVHTPDCRSVTARDRVHDVFPVAATVHEQDIAIAARYQGAIAAVEVRGEDLAISIDNTTRSLLKIETPNMEGPPEV